MKSTALNKVLLKLETPSDIFIHKINKIIRGNKKADEIKYFKTFNKFKNSYFNGEYWDFNGIKLANYPSVPFGIHMYPIFLDTLFVYCKHKDSYNKKLIDKLDNFLPEGAYGYTDDIIDVTVKEKDIVIDAGAWIGDFSAYAVRKGAKVYAFEPCQSTISYLEKTRELNGWFDIVKKGLGDSSGDAYLSINPDWSSANTVTNDSSNNEKIEITTIDEFVKTNEIKRVDFIKSDIEGFERFMLLGARETLKKFSPKLAICTYHFDDDPIVLSNIIHEINPNYKIVQKRKKLYAMVV